MRVVVTAPSAPGAAALHAQAATAALRARGHEAALVDSPRELALAAFYADIVYDTGLLTSATVGAGVLHRPLVVRIGREPYGNAARFARRLVLRRAQRVLCASAWGAEEARRWGLEEERVAILPPAAPQLPALAPRNELRGRLGFEESPVLVHAGRCALSAALVQDMAAFVPEARLVHADGSLPPEDVLELFRAADLAVQPARTGVFPQATLDALAVGRPVLTTRAPGSPELVRDGENGLVAESSPQDLAAAVRRYLGDAGLRERLERSASVSVLAYAPERIWTELETLLETVAQEPA
jgi:glycosyltransferase involved in cell wall biosynthesis